MQYDVLIIGAGAAGMMCAAHTPGRVLIVDHARAPGEKIRISGGGRCNFTNLHCAPHAFLSANPHFAKSALARYSQWDFIDLVDRFGIAWHEKTLGQLFCDRSAKDIVSMFVQLMQKNNVELRLQTSVSDFAKTVDGFSFVLETDGKKCKASTRNVVVATGGKSIPKMGATGFAYTLAKQFGMPVTPTRPALVPFTFAEHRFAALSGISLTVRLGNARQSFEEGMLFTHRGLSGPAVLQMSSYWLEGETVVADLHPEERIERSLRSQKHESGRRKVRTALARQLPERLVDHMAREIDLTGNLADLSQARIDEIAHSVHNFQLSPTGTEGYRTAEVTLGGIDTNALDAKTMAARNVPGLYFIGEAVDVTGWLGGYNFQWAWSSGMAAARALKDTFQPQK